MARTTQSIVMVRDGRGPATTPAVKIPEGDVLIKLRMLALQSSIAGDGEDESAIVARLIRAEYASKETKR